MALMGEQRGYAGLGRYGVRGKKGRGISFFLSEDLWGMGEQWERMG
ncbi:MAG: hypothetical protein HDQ96_09945 [Lachnospiraceae bacterium]|nr:hypothetical protein [Lachnospiraceae bacterium]